MDGRTPAMGSFSEQTGSGDTHGAFSQGVAGQQGDVIYDGGNGRGGGGPEEYEVFGDGGTQDEGGIYSSLFHMWSDSLDRIERVAEHREARTVAAFYRDRVGLERSLIRKDKLLLRTLFTGRGAEDPFPLVDLPDAVEGFVRGKIPCVRELATLIHPIAMSIVRILEERHPNTALGNIPDLMVCLAGHQAETLLMQALRAPLDPRAANPPMVPVPIAELDLGELDFEQLGAPRRKEQDILTRLEDLRQNVSREARALLMNLDEEMGRGIILDDEHSIGRGGFGKVFRGMFHGTPVAIKVIDFHDKGVENRIPLDVFVDELVACCLSSIVVNGEDQAQRSPWIAQFYGWQASEERGYLMLELCDMTLRDFMQNSSVAEHCGYADRLRLLKEVAEGLRDMHDSPDLREFRNIVFERAIVEDPVPDVKLHLAHSDIKSENIMLKKEEDGKYHVRIVDFGLSNGIGTFTIKAMLDERRVDPDRLARGLSPMWAAPEVLKDATATPHSDIFSFGVLIIDMLTERRQPFQDYCCKTGLNYVRGLVMGMNGNQQHPLLPSAADDLFFVDGAREQRATVPLSVFTLVDQCCRPTPSDRLPAGEVVHRLQNLIDEALRLEGGHIGDTILATPETMRENFDQAVPLGPIPIAVEKAVVARYWAEGDLGGGLVEVILTDMEKAWSLSPKTKRMVNELASADPDALNFQVECSRGSRITPLQALFLEGALPRIADVRLLMEKGAKATLKSHDQPTPVEILVRMYMATEAKDVERLGAIVGLVENLVRIGNVEVDILEEMVVFEAARHDFDLLFRFFYSWLGRAATNMQRVVDENPQHIRDIMSESVRAFVDSRRPT